MLLAAVIFPTVRIQEFHHSHAKAPIYFKAVSKIVLFKNPNTLAISEFHVPFRLYALRLTLLLYFMAFEIPLPIQRKYLILQTKSDKYYFMRWFLFPSS